MALDREEEARKMMMGPEGYAQTAGGGGAGYGAGEA